MKTQQIRCHVIIEGLPAEQSYQTRPTPAPVPILFCMHWASLLYFLCGMEWKESKDQDELTRELHNWASTCSAWYSVLQRQGGKGGFWKVWITLEKRTYSKTPLLASCFAAAVIIISIICLSFLTKTFVSREVPLSSRGDWINADAFPDSSQPCKANLRVLIRERSWRKGCGHH